jgi:16S rRNA (guanine966-N2)-methyltransferase
VRIVAGRHRHRRLAAPAGLDVRPTGDRVREYLFNILEHGLKPLDGLTVLDAFAGSGALGLEALSRGAASALLLDNARAALDAIEANIATLGEGGRTRAIRADVTRPPPAPHACDLVFLDPPYRDGIAMPALAALPAAGWLAPGALVVVEQDFRAEIPAPAGYTLATERRIGRARLVLLDYAGGSAA